MILPALFLLCSCAGKIVIESPKYELSGIDGTDKKLVSAIKDYESMMFFDSIIRLQDVLSEIPNYFSAKFYLVLNYYRLGWWESAMLSSEELISYTGETEYLAVLHYISKRTRHNLNILEQDEIEVMKRIRKNHEIYLRKYSIR